MPRDPRAGPEGPRGGCWGRGFEWGDDCPERAHAGASRDPQSARCRAGDGLSEITATSQARQRQRSLSAFRTRRRCSIRAESRSYMMNSVEAAARSYGWRSPPSGQPESVAIRVPAARESRGTFPRGESPSGATLRRHSRVECPQIRFPCGFARFLFLTLSIRMTYHGSRIACSGEARFHPLP